MDFVFRKSPQVVENIKKQNKKITKINNDINQIIKKSIYVTLSTINSRELFVYILVIIISIIFFNYINIKFKSAVGIVIGLSIAYIIYDKQVLDVSSYENQLKMKLELIRPTPKFFGDYPELIEFFYSIRELYNYNNDSFTNCVKDVDSLLRLYSDIKIGIKYCDKNIDIVKSFKKKALNNLHSIVFDIENNKIIEKKLKKSLTELQKILDIYLDDMINICNKDIEVNGYNIEKSYVYKGGPKAYNTFFAKDEYFELY